MRLFRNLRMVQKLLVLSAFYALGMIGFGIGAFSTLDTLRINGSQYQQIVQGKDLIADILPPPVYLVEAYLVAFQVANESDAKQAESHVGRLEVLASDYRTRHEYWAKALEESSLKDLLLVKAHQPAEAFLLIVSQELPALVRAGDVASARTLVAGPLKVAYEAQRQAIDAVVKAATTRNEVCEAAALIQSRTYWLLALAVGTLGLMLVVSGMLGVEMSRSMGLMIQSMTELGRGHLQNARELLSRV